MDQQEDVYCHFDSKRKQSVIELDLLCELIDLEDEQIDSLQASTGEPPTIESSTSKNAKFGAMPGILCKPSEPKPSKMPLEGPLVMFSRDTDLEPLEFSTKDARKKRTMSEILPPRKGASIFSVLKVPANRRLKF